MLRDRGAQFGAISIVNHWTLAILIIGMLGFGLYMEDLPRGPEKGALVQIHKSIGVIVLFLAFWRVAWRIVSRFPADVATMARWQALASRGAHTALLICVLAMPITGYLQSSAGGHRVTLFGLFDLPALGKIPAIAGPAHVAHALIAYALIALIVLHVLAALKHHVVDKDATLRRMLGRRAGGSA